MNLTDSDRVMICALVVLFGALMLLPALSLAGESELDEYIKSVGPFSLEIRRDCRVVRHVIEGDYVVCKDKKWRKVEE